MMITADQINSHLAVGGVVQVTTYLRSTLYTSKHVGWFEQRNGSLYVRAGRRFNKLSIGERLLVGIRLGRVTSGQLS